MTESREPNLYYLIAVGDKEGHSARGPFSSYEEALDQRGPNESAISHTRLERLRNPQPFVAAEDKAVKPPYDWGKLGSRIRSWAWSLVVIGVLSLLMNNLSGTWGVMLILLGLASFYFEVPSMLFVYGITIFWAGLNNAATGGGGLVAAAIQFMIAFGLLRDYVRSIKHERERLATSEAEPERRRATCTRLHTSFPGLVQPWGLCPWPGSPPMWFWCCFPSRWRFKAACRPSSTGWSTCWSISGWSDSPWGSLRCSQATVSKGRRSPGW